MFVVPAPRLRLDVVDAQGGQRRGLVISIGVEPMAEVDGDGRPIRLPPQIVEESSAALGDCFGGGRDQLAGLLEHKTCCCSFECHDVAVLGEGEGERPFVEDWRVQTTVR